MGIIPYHIVFPLRIDFLIHLKLIPPVKLAGGKPGWAAALLRGIKRVFIEEKESGVDEFEEKLTTFIKEWRDCAVV